MRAEVERGDRPSVMILGSGPNRIGQGIEFDYCCVHAAMTVRESGRDAVMVNCNPETVSTDYDTSDRLYFEPLTLEDVLGDRRGRAARGRDRPVRRPDAAEARRRAARPPACRCSAPSPRRSTSPRTAGASARCCGELGLQAPPYATAHSAEEALAAAPGVGFPLLVRPSYVLGGRAMEIVYDLDGLRDYLRRVNGDGREIFLDRFLENAIEVDVDAICDGEDVWIGGIMQHVEEAGIHSGDSACVLPPHSLGGEMLGGDPRGDARGSRCALGVVGLINVQYGVLGDDLYVIEANPRASRTVPFVSKATGLPLAKLACRVMLGERLAALGPAGGSVRRPRLGQGGGAAVRPLRRRRRAARPGDALDRRGDGRRRRLPDRVRQGPGRRRRAAARRAARCSSPSPTPTSRRSMGIAAQLHDLGFRIVATRGTAAAISRMGIPVERLNKIGEGSPHVVDWIERGDVDLVINTPDRHGRAHRRLRDPPRGGRAAGIPCITTISGGMAAARAIAAGRARRAGRWSRCRSCTRGAATGSTPALSAERRRADAPAIAIGDPDRRTLAPFGRRLRASSAPALRRLRRARVRRPRRAARPTPASSTCSPRPSAGAGGDDERPFLPRAFCVLRRARRRELEFLLEDVGPGTRRLCELRRRRRAVAARPARPRLRAAARGPAAAPRRRRRRHRAAGDPGPTRSAPPRSTLLGFRDAPTPRARR